MLYLLTSKEALDIITSNILPEYIDYSAKRFAITKSYQESLKLWKRKYTKLDSSKLFDLKTCKWKYDHKKYMKELEKLAKK